MKISISLEPTSNQEVPDIVNKMKNKMSFDKDGISMKIVKDIITSIVKPVVHICNVSLANGQFPDEMKVAKVVPLQGVT